MTDQNQFADPSSPFDAQRQQLQRRRKMAEALIAKGMEGNTGSGYQGGKVFIVGNPLGNIASSIGGQYLADSSDKEQQTLDSAQRQQESDILTSIPTTPGPDRQAAMLKAMQTAPNLRDAIKLAAGWDESEANRIERGEQSAADRVLKVEEAEANRIEKGEQSAADRVSRQELRSTPTIHISGGGGSRAGIKAPSGYRYNEDGTALEAIPGGPADKQPGSKPLTAKQLETQRGFMDLDTSIANYEKMLSGYDPQGKTATSPAQRAALEGAYTDLQMKLKTLYELGAPQAGDLKLLSQSIPNPTDLGGTIRGAAFGKGPFTAKLNETKKLLNASRTNFETQFGKTTPDAAKPPADRTIVREVKLKDGRIGVEYSDGTRGYK